MIREGRTFNSNKRGRISCPGPLFWQGASIYLSVSPSFCLSVSPSSCPSDSLSLPIPICLHVFLSVCPSVFMSVSLFMSLYLSVSLSLYLSVYLSFCLSVCISVSVSQRNFLLYLYLSVSLSFRLSVSLYLCSCLPIFQSPCLFVCLFLHCLVLQNFYLWWGWIFCPGPLQWQGAFQGIFAGGEERYSTLLELKLLLPPERGESKFWHVSTGWGYNRLYNFSVRLLYLICNETREKSNILFWPLIVTGRVSMYFLGGGWGGI